LGPKTKTTIYVILLLHRKFDKKFDKVRPYMVMYQQPDTQLADQCIYGVVFCEMVRFSQRCSREEDFVAALRTEASVKGSVLVVRHHLY
jgi:hypothetical protein